MIIIVLVLVLAYLCVGILTTLMSISDQGNDYNIEKIDYHMSFREGFIDLWDIVDELFSGLYRAFKKGRK